MPRWRLPRPRFSLLTLLLSVIFVGACIGLWWRWEPWVCELVLRTPRPFFALFSPDGRRIVTGGEDRTVSIWDAQTGREHTLEACSSDAFRAFFSPDGKQLIITDVHSSARIWDPETGHQVGTLGELAENNSWLDFSPDGRRIVTVDRYHTVRTWDAETKRELKAFTGLKPEVWGATFLGNTNRIVVVSQGLVRVLYAETGQELGAIKCLIDACTPCAFAPDGKQFVYTGFDTAEVWDVATGQQRTILKGHSRDFTSIDFPADSRLIVSANQDQTVRIWDAETGLECFVFRDGVGKSVHASFSRDAQRIAMADFYAGNVRVWLRRRPEPWWGIAWLPEFWVAYFSGGALSVIAARQLRRHFAKPVVAPQ